MPRWSALGRTFHWIVAILVVIQIALGWTAEWTQDDSRYDVILLKHAQVGLAILTLAILRLAWRLRSRAPAPPPGEPLWRTRAASATHVLLYVLLLATPISGYLGWLFMSRPLTMFGGVLPEPFTLSPDNEALHAAVAYVHEYAGWALLGLIGLHVAAAVFHRFVLRDDVLRRML